MTTQETKVRLAKKLLQTARTDPSKIAEIAPLIQGLGIMPKQAASAETEDFVRWVLSTQTPMRPSEVESFVKRTLSIPTSPPVKRDTSGPRFKKGDSVMIVAKKHKSPKFDAGNYNLYDGKIGTVTDYEDKDVLVAFQGTPAAVRFPGGQSPRGVGIYKYTAPYNVRGSDKIEMIYFAGGKPSSDAKFVVDAYQSRGKGTEKRSANYYTGHVVMASTGQKGYYFRGFPQQRMQVDPNSEGGFQARTFNPSLGEVFYIGLFGKRPSKWKDELAKMESAAEDA